MPKDSPILVRIFKEESELEVWKQDTNGQFQILKIYPICRWSGELGPKKVQGDRQAPEGFYSITPGLMNPNSNYYLAINIGFPNAYDKSNNYSGAFLMIHGDCSSAGCYAMTDEQIGEIYSLARESFLGGQKEFQIQAYPFRMTPANLARHRNSPNMPFWKMIKEGNDHFEVSHLEPKVDVCDRHYVFDAQPPANSDKAAVVQPDRPLPGLRSAAGNRRTGAGEGTQRRLSGRATDQRQRPGSADHDGNRRRHEQGVRLQARDHRCVLRQRRPRARAADPSRHAAADAEPAARRAGRCRRRQQQAARPVCRLVRRQIEPAAGRGAANQVASTDANTNASAQDHSGFFGSLFKPKNETAAQPPAPQGAVLAGLRPAMEPRKTRDAEGRATDRRSGKTQGQIPA